MALKLSFSCLLLSLLALLPTLCSTYHTFTPSRAAYYGSKDGLGTASGACGYREFGRKVYGGNVAAVSKLFKDGVGCGACYRVRCTNPKLCTKDGVEIMVTDLDVADNTDFVLSTHAFSSMAYQNMAKQLMAYGVVDIEYQRVPCKFPEQNLMVKVHESSRFSEYLSIIFIFQAGQKDILAVELWQEDYKKWVAMRRSFGGVWDIPTFPKGPLKLRFLASEDGKKWVELKNVIPRMWKPGTAYDSGIQLY
ncbi:expansin [Asimina triloba]